MIKKFIFILIIILLSIIFLFSEDATTDNYEKSNGAFEFSTGGGFTHSLDLNVWYTISSFHSNPSKKYSYISIYPLGQSLSFIFPTSFVYHPVKFFGIGGIYIFGSDLILYNGVWPFCMFIHNKLRVVNKFGNLNNKKNWFLLEYGIIFSNVYFPGSSLYNNFYFGPGLFIGYEKIFNKPFAFAIGFNFDGLYQYYEDDLSESYEWHLLFGIETRFRFAYFKELKKKL